jgi:putative DNA primase/helicase
MSEKPDVLAEDLVHDRWPEVLERAGMDSSFFSGRHGPCPFCQGADRYRWSKKYGGVWICNFCTAGRYKGGFEMLMRHMAYSTFAEAANHVRDHFRAGGQAPVKLRNARATSRANDLDQHKRNLERMREIWSKCEPIMSNDPVDLYLQRRVPGLDFVPDMVRFHPNLDYWAPPAHDGGKPVLLGRFPAMVAKAFDAEGRFVQLHKTYLTPEGNKADVPVVKKTERGIGINGFAVPIAPIKGDTLGVAEGIETALAASMFRGIPVWPCLNGPSMAAFSVPSKLLETVQRVVIFADHDALTTRVDAGGSTVYRRPGSDYAEQLAARVRSQGKRVMVIKACRVGQDMVDQWREYNQRSAAGVIVRAPAGRVRAAQPASASV